ncbi:hypothetical protein ACE6H2_022358 [Prunus campanulata]
MCESDRDQTARPCNVNGLPEILSNPSQRSLTTLGPITTSTLEERILERLLGPY